MRELACHLVIDASQNESPIAIILRSLLEYCAMAFYCFPSKTVILGVSVVLPSGQRLDIAPFAAYTSFVVLQDLVNRTNSTAVDREYTSEISREQSLCDELLEAHEIVRQFLDDDRTCSKKILIFTTQKPQGMTTTIEEISSRGEISPSELYIVYMDGGELSSPLSDIAHTDSAVPSKVLAHDVNAVRGFLIGLLKPSTAVEKEHIQLVLDNAERIVLKCDTVSKILDFTHFPLVAQMLYSGVDGPVFPVSTFNAKVTQQLRTTVTRLKVIHSVPVEHICETVSFGFPCVVISTTASTYEWVSAAQTFSGVTY